MIRKDIGSVYDVVFFGCVAFNRKAVCKRLFRDENTDINEKLPEYCEVKSIVGEIPKYLQVFWMYDDKHRSILDSLLDELDWATDDFDTYVKLISNSDWFKQFFIATHWPKLAKENVLVASKNTDQLWVLRLLEDMEGPENYCLYLKYVLDNWDTVIPELLITVKKIHNAVLKCMEYKKAEIEQFYAQFERPEVLKQLAAALCYDIEEIPNGYISLSFLHSLMRCNNANYVFIILGFNALDDMLSDREYDIKWETLTNCFGDITRTQIINMLFRKKYCSCAEIADSLFCSISNVQYHLNILLTEGFIKISSKKGNAYFYCINADYIDKLFTLLGFNALDDMMRGREYDIKWETLANCFGDITRAQIIDMLFREKYCSCAEIADSLFCSISNVQYHLNILLTEGFIKISSKKGKAYFYCINLDYIDKLGAFIDNMKIELRYNLWKGKKLGKNNPEALVLPGSERGNVK